MVQPLTLEGTGAELQEHLRQHPEERFRLILLTAKSAPADQPERSGLRRGMFPQLLALTDEDFKAAEWHGEDSEP